MTVMKAPPTADADGAELQYTDAEAEERHYTPEEAYEKKLVLFTPRMIRQKAYRREIPHSKEAGKVSLKLRHIRLIAAMYEVEPLSATKPRPVRKTPAAA